MNPLEPEQQTRVHALELRESQLPALIHSVSPALISVDETQTIVLFNAEAEVIFRCSSAQAIGTSLERFVPVSPRAVHRSQLVNFDRVSGHDARILGGDGIFIGQRADGEEFPIEAVISHSDFGGRRLVTVMLRDVSERIRQQEMLHAQADIIASASEAIISRSADGTILTWNLAAARMFGYASEEAIGSNVRLLYPNTAPADHIDLAQRALRGEAVINFPTRRRRKDGSEIDVEVTISPVKRRDGSVIGTSAIYTDSTARKRMEAKLRQAAATARESRDRLRELSAALQTIREEEKTRIARELHDELGQALTALKMDTMAITGEVESASDLALLQDGLRQRLETMKQMIDATVASVRRIAADLRPMMLDNLGLVPTLEWLTSGFASRTGICVDLAVSNENLGVSGDAATAIFRIVQEALTNVARHSGAHAVSIEVIRSGGKVVVRVRDDGKGIAELDMRKVRSFGLLGMRERAYVLGGDLTISRAPQGGTVIEAAIPAFGTT